MITIDASKKAEKEANVSRSTALNRIAEIRGELVDALTLSITGTPKEQGEAKAAIALLRAELAIQKAKA